MYKQTEWATAHGGTIVLQLRVGYYAHLMIRDERSGAGYVLMSQPWDGLAYVEKACKVLVAISGGTIRVRLEEVAA
jgi:hypothetical protein